MFFSLAHCALGKTRAGGLPWLILYSRFSLRFFLPISTLYFNGEILAAGFFFPVVVPRRGVHSTIAPGAFAGGFDLPDPLIHLEGSSQDPRPFRGIHLKGRHQNRQ